MNTKETELKPDKEYLGIPRKEIPWFPSIDHQKCDECKKCTAFCKLKTYSYDEKRNIVEVTNPYNCVVGCNGCEGICPNGAINFPSTSVIDEVRKKYNV